MRALLAAVIAMGVLIVVGTTTLIVMLVERMGQDHSAQSVRAQTLALPPGSRLISAQSDGKSMLLLLQTGDHQQIQLRRLDDGSPEAIYNVTNQ